MDIVSAEKHVRKLLEYVQSLKSSESTLYEKSKVRLRELSDTCSEVISTICEVLNDEVAEDDDTEFSGDSRYLARQIDDMQKKLDDLKKFSDATQSRTEKYDSASSLKPITSTEKKNAMTIISRCLNELPDHYVVLKYDQAKQCAELLRKWFHTRFFECSKDFHYNIRNIKDWIQDIVLYYGYHLKSGDIDSAVSGFYNWLNLLYDEHVPYALPYDVISCKDSDFCYTLDAAILWDILMDGGLDTLCSISPPVLAVSPESIYTACGEHNPSCLDNYAPYSIAVDKLNWPDRK